MITLARVVLVTIVAPLLASADDGAGTLEVDLIFPRNDTYAPVPLMPIVFAIQNPALAYPLDLQLSWQTFPYGNFSSPNSWSAHRSLNNLNASVSNPYLVSFYAPSFQGIESEWVFKWSLTTANCSFQVGMPTYTYHGDIIHFTTKDAAQSPNLVAATSGDTCAMSESKAFNVTAITGTLFDDGESQRTSCAVFGAVPTHQNPCAVKIDNAAASSISAALSSSASSATSGYNPTATPSSRQRGDAGQISRPSTAGLLGSAVLILFSMF